MLAIVEKTVAFMTDEVLALDLTMEVRLPPGYVFVLLSADLTELAQSKTDVVPCADSTFA